MPVSEPNRRILTVASVVAVILGTAFSSALARVWCIGDCANSGRVTIADLAVGVNIALGSAPISSCPAFDGSGTVSIDLLITAVQNALSGCPTTPTATAAVTPRVTTTAARTSQVTALPTPTPTPAGDPVLIAITDAFTPLCGAAQSNYVHGGEGGYYGFCSANDSQHTTLRIERHESAEAASVAFGQASAVGPPYDFERLPAVYWERGFAAPTEGGTRTMVWQLDCWVITVSSYDSRGRLTLSPQAVSRKIFDDAAVLLSGLCPLQVPPPTPTPTKNIGPDLVVSAVRATAHNQTCQPYATLDMCVANAGHVAAGEFAVAIAPGDDHFTLPGVPAGGEQCANRAFPGRGSALVTIEVDINHAVDESDET